MKNQIIKKDSEALEISYKGNTLLYINVPIFIKVWLFFRVNFSKFWRWSVGLGIATLFIQFLKYWLGL